MKTPNLFTLSLATLLVLVAGCKDAPVRTTKLPGSDGAATTSLHGTDLSTSPLAGGGEAGAVTPVAGENEFLKGGLPDDSKLLGRDQDRTTFASQTVYFEFDHANVPAGEASKIDQVAAQFKTMGASYDLLIEGNCDERGTEEYNRALGERRALAIRELLIQSGVDSGHVFTKSFGKDNPAAAGHDETAWSRNRRGEFVLVLPQKITTTQNAQ